MSLIFAVMCGSNNADYCLLLYVCSITFIIFLLILESEQSFFLHSTFHSFQGQDKFTPFHIFLVVTSTVTVVTYACDLLITLFINVYMLLCHDINLQLTQAAATTVSVNA